MINIFEVTADLESLFFVQPKHMGAVSFAGFALNRTCHSIFGDVYPREKTLTVDFAIMDVSLLCGLFHYVFCILGL